RRCRARRFCLLRAPGKGSATARTSCCARGASGCAQPRRACPWRADCAIRLSPEGGPNRPRPDAGRRRVRQARRICLGGLSGVDGVACQLPHAAARGTESRQPSNRVDPLVLRGTVGSEHAVNEERSSVLGDLRALVTDALATTRGLSEEECRCQSAAEGWPAVIVAYHTGLGLRRQAGFIGRAVTGEAAFDLEWEPTDAINVDQRQRAQLHG